MENVMSKKDGFMCIYTYVYVYIYMYVHVISNHIVIKSLSGQKTYNVPRDLPRDHPVKTPLFFFPWCQLSGH